MQNDDVIWQIINHQFCSFKTKVAKEHTFCLNPYNVTGLCLRSACPLANSRYATIREHEGDCYLYVKTIERAHTPRHLWEKIKLPSDYSKALAIVSSHLEHFPKYLVHRNKQRLTKIHQMLIRMRKLKLRARPQIETTNRKVDKREKGREKKALAAAQLEKAIENELLERLRQATEGEIFNYPEQQYNSALNKAAEKFERSGGEQILDPDAEKELEDEEEVEDEVQELEEEEEDESVPEYDVEYVEDIEESDEEEDEGSEQGSLSESKRYDEQQPDADLEELAAKWLKRHGNELQSAGSKRKAATNKSIPNRSSKRREIEYEVEDEEETQQITAAATEYNSRSGKKQTTAARRSARIATAASNGSNSMHFNF